MNYFDITTICFFTLLLLMVEPLQPLEIMVTYLCAPLLLILRLYTYLLYWTVKPLLKRRGIVITKNPFVYMMDGKMRADISITYNLPMTRNLFMLYHQVLFKELKGVLRK